MIRPRVFLSKKLLYAQKEKQHQLFSVKFIEKNQGNHEKIVNLFLKTFKIFGKGAGLNQGQCSYLSSK